MSALLHYVPRTGRRSDPLTLTSYVIFSLMLCIVPFPSFPWNRASPDISVTISFLFRLHSSHSDWNKTRFMSTAGLLRAFSYLIHSNYTVCFILSAILSSCCSSHLRVWFIKVFLWLSILLRWLSLSSLLGWWRSTKQQDLCPMAWLSPQTLARR